MLWYFGYGSNMDLTSLGAKGVVPRASERALLRGWRLRFNVQHWFRHEGGVGNIEPSTEPGAVVRGVVHACEEGDLAALDAAEAYGHGYDRIEVAVATDAGERRAVTYVGMAFILDDACLPTQRYLNILIQGATKAGLDPAYVEELRRHPVHAKVPFPRFTPPPGEHPTFDEATLARHPLYTAVAGAVFDMTDARPHHRYVQRFFGGRDMTTFHLRRMDGATGAESIEDVRRDLLTPAQRLCLEEYLYEYSREYRYVGRYVYDVG